MNSTIIKNLVLIITFLSVIVVFIIDSLIPLGVAGGVPYIIPILLSLWSRNVRLTFSLAIICSILTLTGLYSSPEGGELWKVLFNRGLAIFAIWACTLLTSKYFTQITNQILLEQEIEKFAIYRQTITGVNHLVRNLQNNFQLINHSKSFKNEFGEETVKLLNQSSKEVTEILEQLENLEDVSVDSISRVTFSNVKKS